MMTSTRRQKTAPSATHSVCAIRRTGDGRNGFQTAIWFSDP
jgi:hypothetical protein